MEKYMPRGVPKSGKRRRRTKAEMMAARGLIAPNKPKLVVSNETEAQIEARIGERFDILKYLTDATISGESRALVVSGPAGLGKSFTIEAALRQYDPNEINHTIIKGYVKATGLYKKLYQYREKGKVIVFDDADSIFYDDVSLNMLKAVCDTNERRRVSYLSEATLIDEENAERIPSSFEFEGSIIFITNIDFDEYIDRGHKLSPHLNALMSRSHYIDLTLKNERDYIVRIKQVIREGLFDHLGLYEPGQAQFSKEVKEIVQFILKHSSEMRKLSLREALKIAALRKKGGNWEAVARVTCCR